MSVSQRSPERSPAVLVADDDPNFRDFMAEALTRAGYRVRRAENGRRALDLLKETEFDAVVTDIYMPQADAIDVVRELRRRHPGVPVVVVTGDSVGGHEPILRFLLHLGVTKILAKPFSPDLLQQAVAAVLADRPSCANDP